VYLAVYPYGLRHTRAVGRLFRMARKPKRQPVAPAKRRPSGLAVVLAFGVAVAAAAALIVAAVVLREDDSGATPTPTPTPTVDFSGIPQDGTMLGSPEATVTLIEYADLQCPACRAYAETYVPGLVEQYARPGRIRMEFRGIAFIGPDSETALRYVLAAGLQDRLWNLQEAMYRNQGGENSGWVTEELVRELAADIEGLDADQMVADAESAEVEAMMAEAAQQAQEAGVRGTPTLAIQVGDAEPTTLESVPSFSELTQMLDDAIGS
jgi:protein-disulfide isomerase